MNNNKNFLLESIEKLENQIKALRKQINCLNMSNQMRANINEYYYYIQRNYEGSFITYSTIEKNNETDNNYFNCGNYFLTLLYYFIVFQKKSLKRSVKN